MSIDDLYRPEAILKKDIAVTSPDFVDDSDDYDLPFWGANVSISGVYQFNLCGGVDTLLFMCHHNLKDYIAPTLD